MRIGDRFEEAGLWVEHLATSTARALQEEFDTVSVVCASASEVSADRA